MTHLDVVFDFHFGVETWVIDELSYLVLGQIWWTIWEQLHDLEQRSLWRHCRQGLMLAWLASLALVSILPTWWLRKWLLLQNTMMTSSMSGNLKQADHLLLPEMSMENHWVGVPRLHFISRTIRYESFCNVFSLFEFLNLCFHILSIQLCRYLLMREWIKRFKSKCFYLCSLG